MIPRDNITAWRAQVPWLIDVQPILRPGFSWDFDVTMDTVLESLVAQLPAIHGKARWR